MWETSVITTQGLALLSQWVQGQVLTITSARGGTGTTPAAQLKSLTALASEKQTAEIASLTREGNVATIKIQFSAAETAYTLQQIGFWAKIGNGTPVLFAVFQDATGSAIPAEEMSQFVYNFFGAFTLSGDGELTVTISTSAFVTMTTLEQYLLDYVPTYEKGEANGIAPLDSSAKIPVTYIPTLGYIPTGQKGTANGVASLGSDGKVPSTQLPALNYVPIAQRAAANGVATLDSSTKVPKAQLPDLSDVYILVSKRAAANGVASLDSSTKVPKAQLPDLSDTYIAVSQKGANNGVATLGSNGKVPSSQLPSLDYIPTSQKAAANGVASLASDGKVPANQLRGGFIVSTTAPSDTTLLWITPDGVMKFYYNSAWRIVVPTWG